MEAVTYDAFRDSLRAYIDKMRDGAEPVLVTGEDPESNVVVMSVRDYDNLIENLCVLSNGYLSDKIERGLTQARAGGRLRSRADRGRRRSGIGAMALGMIASGGGAGSG